MRALQGPRPLLWPGPDLLPRLPQSLQNSSYNHFAAIYYLLLERLKEYRGSPPLARPGLARQPRPRSSDHSGLEVSGGLKPHPSVPWVREIPCSHAPRSETQPELPPPFMSPHP